MADDGPARAPAGEHPLRVVVADDEPHNRAHVALLLRREPDVAVVGEAGDGAEAVEAIRALAPDLVFLDVQMPELTGLEVVAAVGAERMPATVFVTAYDRYAVAAFDVAAVDYLVKPFDDDRFARALDRARAVIAARAAGRVHRQLLSVLHGGADPARLTGLAPAGLTPASLTPPGLTAPGVTPAGGGVAVGGGSAGPYLERLAVDVAGRVHPVRVRDIDYITASGAYAELHAGGRRHVVREALHALEGRLDPAKFLRVHRSAIVRLDAIESFRRVAGGDGEVVLRGGATLRVSRTRRDLLERWLGVGSG